MLRSRYYLPTLREAPRDADNVSAKLMIRSGMIRKIAAGLYEWLPLGLRVLKKVENIVREEMNAAGAHEVWLPHVQPKELWQETGRWQLYGKELLRIQDRKKSEFCFAPTAEEVITDLVRRDTRSWKDLPICLYQFGTKFRDEIRPRFGVMRAREFYMKDAYSFHADEADLGNFYERMVEAYHKIFSRCGLRFRPVEADTGAIGGSSSHEFMVLAETGEEAVVSCPHCGYAANVERAESAVVAPAEGGAVSLVEDVATPNAWTVEEVAALLKESKERFIKTLFYIADSRPVVALVRGDDELNELKLARALGSNLLRRMSDAEYEEYAGCKVGFAGPIGLSERARGKNAEFVLIADQQVPKIISGISGANREGYHQRGIAYERDYKADQVVDLRTTRMGDHCLRCREKGKESVLEFARGIEVGHAFKLGTKYSKAMQAEYLNAAGESHPFVMGCYGIGVSRVVAAAIEQNSDDWGICWPAPIAPFQVAIIPVQVENAQAMELAGKIAAALEARGLDVLLDDRAERAGVKFKDVDLIGIPLRITLGEKSLAQNSAELKWRTEKEVKLVPLSQLLTGDIPLKS